MKNKYLSLMIIFCLIINLSLSFTSETAFAGIGDSIKSIDGKYELIKVKSGGFKNIFTATAIDIDNIFFMGNDYEYPYRNRNDKAYIYNVSRNSIKEVATLPDFDYAHLYKPFYKFSTLLKNGNVLVVTGGDVAIYNPRTDKWELRKNEVEDRLEYGYGQFVVKLPNDNIVFFFGSENIDRYWEYNPYNRSMTMKKYENNRILNLSYSNEDAGNAIAITNDVVLVMGMKKLKRDGGWTSGRYYSRIFNLRTGEFLEDYSETGKYLDSTYGVKLENDVILHDFDLDWNPYTLDNMYLLNINTNKKTRLFEHLDLRYFLRDNIAYYQVGNGLRNVFFEFVPLGTHKAVFLHKGNILMLKKKTPPVINNFNAPNVVHVGEPANLTWNATDQDGDSLKYILYIGNSEGTNEYIVANTTTNSYKFNVPNDVSLYWNSSTGRYERRIYARLVASDGTNEVQKDSYFTAVNYKPNVIGYASGSKVSYGNDFIITGKVWDINSDKLTVECTIDGKKKTTTLNSSPSSQPSGNNYNFTWNDLNPGVYEEIKVKVIDQYGKYQEIVIGNVTVKDPLGDLNDKLDKVPKKSNELLFVATNTDTVIDKTSRNDNLNTSIKSKLSNRVAEDLFFVGESGSTKTYIQSNLTPKYVTNTQDKVTEFADYIANIVQAKSSTTFLSGDILEYNMLFEDIEKDYQNISVSNKLKSNGSLSDLLKKWKDGTLQVKYNHNPSVFDNPVAKHSKGNDVWKSISNIDDSWVIKKADSSMRGQWTMTIKASDTTKNSGFDKFTDDVMVNFIIHEKPKAIIEYNDDGSYLSLSGESSYDSDFQYQLPDNGITKYEWYYLLDGNWQKWSEENQRVKIPRFMGGKEVKGYYLTVTDSYGATDKTQEKSVISYKLQSALDVEDTKFSTNSIPASENIKVTGIKTIPGPTDTIHFAIYKNTTQKTSDKILNKNSDVLSADVLVANWRDIRNYKIDKTLPDGSYTAKVTAIKGSTVLTNDHNLVVNTPINLMPAMPSLFYVGEKIKIVATTSKYADSVTVDVFSDGNSENMNYIKQENDIKYWELDYTVPLNTDGGHIATFKATTPNGNIESTTLNFVLVALTVTGEVNHTTKWNENRIKYNVAKTGDTDNPRTYDVFFPGEKFMLKASTNVGANADRVDVEIIGTPYSTSLVNTSGDTWEGSIWHEDMIDWSDRTLTFRFKAYKNGIERVDNVTVKIVDDEYWRLHRKF